MKRPSPIRLPLDQIADFCRQWKIREFSLFGRSSPRGFSTGQRHRCTCQLPTRCSMESVGSGQDAAAAWYPSRAVSRSDRKRGPAQSLSQTRNSFYTQSRLCSVSRLTICISGICSPLPGPSSISRRIELLTNIRTISRGVLLSNVKSRSSEKRSPSLGRLPVSTR